MIFLRYIRGVIVITSLSVLVLGINVAQMLSVILLLLGRERFVRFNMGCKNLFCFGNAIGAKLCENRLIITGDVPGIEDTIVMANHQSMVDIPIVWAWGYPLGVDGRMKWFVKDSFKYAPGPGWGLWFLDTLFVKRNWSKDAESVRKTFRILAEGCLPFWVMIFPEGTRLTRSKLIASRGYAQRRGLPVFDKVLVPRPKGVWASIQGLRSKINFIYDVSIGYETSEAPTLGQFFCRGGYHVHVHTTRIPLATVPAIERDFNQWMMQRFTLKDQWLKTIMGSHENPHFK